MTGVLGIGADLGTWSEEQLASAARWIALYKDVRDVVHHGDTYVLGSPDEPTFGVESVAPGGARVVVAALSTGRLDGSPLVPGRPDRLHLKGVDAGARYRDEADGQEYGGAYLRHVGLPFCWSAEHDAELTVLRRL